MQVLKVSQLQQRQQKNALGILTLGTLIFQGINVLILLLLLGAFIGLKQKEPPAMVQLQGGKTIAMEPIDSRQRTPAVIQKFVQDQFMLLFSASGQIPAGSGASSDGSSSDGSTETERMPDPGVEVSTTAGRLKVTTLAHLASFGISESFRSEFVRALAERTPQNIFSDSSDAQRALIIQDISAPEPIAEGQWKVTVISSLVDFDSANPIGVPKPFNKEVFVQSVPIPEVQQYSSPLERQIAEVRQSGLEIYAIRNYVRPTIRSSQRIEDVPFTEP